MTSKKCAANTSQENNSLENVENPLNFLMIEDSNRNSLNIGRMHPLKQMTQNDATAFVHRQSSIASIFNLSINNDCDSQFSQYAPSINEAFVPEDADPIEKQMHAFLDQYGVKQINIKDQLKMEKQSTVLASQNRLSFMQKGKSPSFMERRQMRVMASVKGGVEQQSAHSTSTNTNTGPRSVMLSPMIVNDIRGGGRAQFNTEIFQHANKSTTKHQVEEEKSSSRCMPTAAGHEKVVKYAKIESLHDESSDGESFGEPL